MITEKWSWKKWKSLKKYTVRVITVWGYSTRFSGTELGREDSEKIMVPVYYASRLQADENGSSALLKYSEFFDWERWFEV